jgi:hypothetical protein
MRNIRANLTGKYIFSLASGRVPPHKVTQADTGRGFKISAQWIF